jgi:hypothetical protein
MLNRDGFCANSVCLWYCIEPIVEYWLIRTFRHARSFLSSSFSIVRKFFSAIGKRELSLDCIEKIRILTIWMEKDSHRFLRKVLINLSKIE